MTKHDPLSILYINLDDPFFTEIYKDSSRLYQIIDFAEKLSGKKVEYLFLDEIRQFSFSLKRQSRARKKVYAIDNGILANVSFRFSANRGKLFENLVYSEFKKSGYEIHLYQNKGECDFIVSNGYISKINRTTPVDATSSITRRISNDFNIGQT